MSNIAIHRRWAAIPLDLLLNPVASLAAKVLAGIIYSLDVGSHQLCDFSDSLNLTNEEISAALTVLEDLGILTSKEVNECYNISVY